MIMLLVSVPSILILLTAFQPVQSFFSSLSHVNTVQGLRKEVNVRCRLHIDSSETENDVTIMNHNNDKLNNRRHGRRGFFQQAFIVSSSRIVTGVVTSNIFFTSSLLGTTPVTHAVVMDPTIQKVFEVGKDLTTEQAIQRFLEGKQSLEYLVDHYDEICMGGGDNVRRYLGTVGVGSGLYGISKVLKILQKSDGLVDDVVEFSDLSDELISAINQADGSAYMAIFTTFSSSSTPPKKYFDDSKVEAKTALRIMNELSEQLNLTK